jgi:hypothetical protein
MFLFCAVYERANSEVRGLDPLVLKSSLCAPSSTGSARTPQLSRTSMQKAWAELLLAKTLVKIGDLCVGRERLKKEQGGPTKGRVLVGRRW